MMLNIVIEAMAKSGCTPEQISVVARAVIQAEQSIETEKKTERRQSDAERKRRQRSRNVTLSHADRLPSSGQTVTSRDILGHAQRFYSIFPKKIGPRDAEAAFAKAVNRGVDPQHIIDAAIKYAEAHKAAGTEKQFIPAPTVWLNRGGYDEKDLPQAPKPGPKPNGGHPAQQGVLWFKA